ncbi:GAF domain-containing protein [Mitsuaria sp. GD03876]|uniref:GAF domain-containing protein n=1 Tax=Mitsuaria sp. GD03876 TaxID=2975399 RepID=UPI0024488781|nr:GAF domain-containing protein [Mitsuaria sp. GD03876]MDH0863832.1 GAF domain-containing protein [Mitsuaria sp. GD03876]
MTATTLVALLMACGIAALLAQLIRERRAHRAALAHAQRLGQVLLTLSRANRMVLRIDDDRALFQEACQICVDAGNAALAAVYVRDGDLAHRVAAAGPAADTLRNVPDPLDLRLPEVQGTYTARVLRDGLSVVSNDYVLDAQAGRWRTEAVAQGIRAIAWIPIRRAGEVAGTLMLCARQPDFFDDALMALLEELGADLSFALDSVDGRQAREAAAREIEAGRDRFQRLFEAAPVPMAIVSVADRRIVEANPALCRRYGRSRDEVIGTTTASHAYGVIAEDRDLFYRVLVAEGHVNDMAVRMRDAAGQVRPAVLNAEPLEYLGQPCCLIISLELQRPPGPAAPPAPSSSTTSPKAFPTGSPSASPTASPTASPSASPWASPTASPSASPTSTSAASTKR